MRAHIQCRVMLLCLLSAVLAGFGPVAAAQPAPSTAPQPSNFEFLRDRQPVISLEGRWRFHPGDDPRWADPAFDDSAWPALLTDRPWSVQGYPAMSGFGWYRFTVLLPATDKLLRPLSIELGPILTSYQVYFDGQLAGQLGQLPPNPTPQAALEFKVFPLPQSPSPTPRVLHVALRVWHSPIWASYVGGGPQSNGQLLGDTALLQAELEHHTAHRQLLFVDLFTYSVAALIISITIFGLYVFRPKEREYLWFALLLFAKSADFALSIAKEIYSWPAIPVFDLLDGALVAGAQVALLLFLARVLHVRRGLWWSVVIVMAVLSAPAGVLYWPGWLSVPVSALLCVLLILPSCLWMLATMTSVALHREDSTARLLLVPVLLIQGFYFADNVIVALNQSGLAIDPRVLETPFITVPYTLHPAVLAELLFLLAMLAFLIGRFTTARRREERWEGTLEAARQVQQLLLPESMPCSPGFLVDCVYRPADVVGGDFFQILPTPDCDLLIVVGDVAGKGLPAAMMVSTIIGTLRAEATHTTDPAQLLGRLNDSLAQRPQSGFTTCLIALICRDGRMIIANAGHLPPYRNGQEMPIPGALPLGMLAGLVYDRINLELAPGDRVAFVSDGVVEAQDKAGHLLGFDRTEQLSGRPASEIADAASAFGQVDDITVVTVAFDPVPVSRVSELESAGPAIAIGD